MNFENQVKGSPLEKAKRLKEEKEKKDSVKVEAEAQPKTEKLNNLNFQKQGLENKLSDVDTRIEASKGEAHETRDVMKDGELDQDEEFKGEYGFTISEVAGNLNELRNERNNIKAELEKINSDIENFGVNEVVAENNKEETLDDFKEKTELVIDTIFEEVNSKLRNLEENANNFSGGEKEFYRISNDLDFVRWELSPMQVGVRRNASNLRRAWSKFSDEADKKKSYNIALDMEKDILLRSSKINQKAKEIKEVFDKKWSENF
jgi:uncharacterized protein (DUF3084 family)